MLARGGWQLGVALLASVVLSSTVPSVVLAQGCCTPGTSALGGLTGGPLLAGNIEAGLAVEGYDLRQAYRGNDRVADPANRRSQVLSTTFYSRIGLHKRVAAIVRLPYEYRMREQTVILGTQAFHHEFSNTALGDLTTLVMARVLPFRPFASWGIQLGAGIKWATGRDDATQDGLIIPVELQTGTGSTDPVLALVAYQSSPRFSVSSSALARFPREGRTGYRYGNELQLSVVGLWNWSPTLRPGIELRGRLAGADEFAGRKPVNTGGTRWMSGLRVLKEFPGLRLGVEAAFLLPLYQTMTGLQLGVDRQLSLNVRWQLR
ncbi:MAG: hypothetical protein ACE5G2_00795 [Candidatus Krumholzibacteriia bacterium]